MHLSPLEEFIFMCVIYSPYIAGGLLLAIAGLWLFYVKQHGHHDDEKD